MNYSNFKNKKQDDVKLKYYNTDCTDFSDRYNPAFVDYRDTLFAPTAKNIDIDSKLIQSKLTNCKVKHTYGQLPYPTIPQKFQLSHNNSKLKEEDQMKFLDYNNSLKKKTCIPKDDKFFNRSFYIFDTSNNIELPNPLNSVERPEICWAELRCGRPTRFDRRPQ